jgi:hypothetical protein
MEQLFPPLTEDARRLMDRLPALVDETSPLPGRFRSSLLRAVAELSRLLTSGRGELRESYLGEGALLAAYLRYFLPWNVYRLARLLPSLELPLSAAPGEAPSLIDLGSGPLTFPVALWISRPDLRTLPLEFRCLDRAAPALRAGKLLFEALSGSGCPWKIKTVHASLGDPIRFPRAGLVAAVNLFNELFRKLPRRDHGALSAFAKRQARLLSSLCLDTGSVFVLEPGVPRCGEFISLLREALSLQGRFPRAPCDHAGPCPLPGLSPAAHRAAGPDAKWCHFAFDTADAPSGLRRLSEAARLPKDRSALSFLLTGPLTDAGAPRAPNPAPEPAASLGARIVSDPFPLGDTGAFGRYGCSSRGLVVASGKKRDMERLESGTLELFALKTPEQRDRKSGALMVELPAKPLQQAD